MSIADDIEATFELGRKLLTGETTVDEVGEAIFGRKPANDNDKPAIIITPAAPASSPTTPPPPSDVALEQAKALATVTPIRR